MMLDRKGMIHITSKILNGNSCVFAGAGVSTKVTNLNNEEISSASGFANKLFRECSLDETGELSWAAEIYEQTFGQLKLIQKLKKEFTGTSVPPSLHTLTSLPWKGYYTTNYDNALEISFSDKKRPIRSTTSLSKPSEFSDKKNLIIHINGFIEQLHEDESIPRDFLLGDFSYAQSQFSKSEWYRHLQSDFLNSDYFFFVGFSLRSDLDIQRIATEYENSQLKNRLIFVVRENEPKTNVLFLEKFGNVWAIGLDEFCKIVEEAKKEFVPSQLKILKLFSFSKIQTSVQSLSDPLVDDVFKLLFSGNVDYDLLNRSLFTRAC